MTTTRNRPARPGYTLVEILVVMSLIILLAALALGVSQSGMFGSQKVISGGDRASGWLLIAKQRAMRDGLPRGVRFFNTTGGITGNPNAFTEAAYIEQPDAWVPNVQQEGNPSGARIVFVYPWLNDTSMPPKFASFVPPEVYYVSGTTTDLDEYDQRVAVDDLLVLPELGKSFRVTTVNAGASVATSFGNPAVMLTAANSRRMVLASMPDFSAAGNLVASATAPRLATLTTFKFGFQKPAQPLLGEPALQMTGGTSIDSRSLTTSPANTDSRTVPAVTPPWNPTTTIGVTAKVDPATGGNFFDILFSPSGQVLDNNSGIVCLWVRDTTKGNNGKDHPRASGNDCDDPLTLDAAGQMVLIVLNPRNGLLSTQPINPSAAKNPVPASNYDPYLFAKDGINSGL